MSDWLQQLSEREKQATPEKWYVVGPPWGDGGFVVAGNSDPHVGSYVCNTDDLLVMDDEEAKEHGASNKLADAEFIVALRNSASDLIDRARRAEELERENAEWYGAVAALVELLTPYYWHSEDEELHAVNRLRRMVGWREQLGKDEGEAELRADEAEDA